MNNRTKLHSLLLSMGCPNVYYQIPSGMVVQFPCIKYSLDRIDNKSANDSTYIQNNFYTVTVMDKNCDSELVSKISKLVKCNMERQFVKDNIYHTIFNLYY